MKVISYLGGVPNVRKSPHKLEVLRRFAEGVNRHAGDTGIAVEDRAPQTCDVGVIQGWVHAGSKLSPHLKLRKRVSENTHNRHTVIVDSNLFNYTGIENPHYSRYSIDGVFPTTAGYFWDRDVDPQRWQQIQRDYNISLKDWRARGDAILVCTQRNGGWSMDGLDVVEWLDTTVKKIRHYSDRPIIVRGHPGDKRAQQYLGSLNRAWELSTSASILDDFNRACCVVNYNSSPGVAAAIEGLPVFVTDPHYDGKRSQARPVANINLSRIENPELFDRQQWIERIAMSHWHFDELSNGSAWAHMRKFVCE
jgi:hypothetical protein